MVTYYIGVALATSERNIDAIAAKGAEIARNGNPTSWYVIDEHGHRWRCALSAEEMDEF